MKTTVTNLSAYELCRKAGGLETQCAVKATVVMVGPDPEVEVEGDGWPGDIDGPYGPDGPFAPEVPDPLEDSRP